METNKEVGIESEMGKTGSIFNANKDESHLSEQQNLTQDRFINPNPHTSSI